MAEYTLSQDGKYATRSSDGAFVPWDVENNQPLDIGGLAGEIWRRQGSPLAVAPPPPPPSTVVTFDQWLALFTPSERAWAFTSDDANVREMIARGSAASAIDLSSPTVASFLDLSIALGSPLTAERKAQVLAGTPPA